MRGARRATPCWLHTLVVLGACILLDGPRAHAEDTLPITLNWVRAEGAESCFSGEELNAELHQALAADSVVPAPLVIEGLVARPDHGPFQVQLRVLDAQGKTVGKRVLTSGEPSCEQLKPALVLVLALLVELSSHAPPAAPIAAQVPAIGIDSERPRALRPASPAPAPTRRPWQADLSAALSLATQLTPDASVGPQLGLRVRSPWWLAGLLRAGYWPGGRTRIASPDAQLASADFHAFVADLDVCLPALASASWWLASCWGGAFIVRKASVQGLSRADDTLRATGAASASLQLAFTVYDRFSLNADASLLASRRRDRYAFEDVQGAAQSLFHPGHFAGVFAVGLGVQL